MAQVDYFLKIEGVEGESKDSKHKGEIDIGSFSFGASQAGNFAQNGGGGAGKVQMRDFSFSMLANKATPRLFLACATGQHIKKAVVIARKAGGKQEEFLKWTFSDVIVSSYQTSGGSGDSIPQENFALNFAKVEVEYKEQKADGSLGGVVTAGYDLKANKIV